MRMLDLFSGIGGFALAAEWVWGDELDITGFCEIEKYAQKVLQKNFPGVPIHDDITKLNGKDFKNIDLITGGFPCQDISIANQNNPKGIEGKRSGLWSEMWRIISEIRPRFALIENVPILTIRGGTRVIADLAEIGYDAEWQSISAKQVGAWHKRERIWIAAYPSCDRMERPAVHAKTNKKGIETTPEKWFELQFQNHGNNKIEFRKKDKSFLCGDNDGIPFRLDFDRRNRLKGLGNAIVPQVAALIMERIKDAE